MTTPSDPFAPPPGGGQPAPPGPAPYGQPSYGAQPSSGQSAYGQPSYGVPASPFGRPGGPQLAGWWSRVAAALLDGIAFSVLYYAPLVLGVISGSDVVAGVLTLVGFLAGMGFWVWNHVRQGRTGATIGKSALGIQVRREADGRLIGAGLSLGRSVLHVVDAIPCYLGFLWPLWDAKNQTFADKIVSTVVVKG